MALNLVVLALIVYYLDGAPSNVKCPFPQELPNGKVALTGQVPGSKMTFSCDVGYWREGPEESTCQPDGRWSVGAVSCQTVECPLLPNPQYGAVDHQGQGYGETMTVQCKPGYVYTGTLPRVCQANNTWSGRDGHCIHAQTKICPIVKAPDHGKVNMTGIRFNDSMKVTCKGDYWYTGSAVRVCQGDGHWSGTAGVCKRKDSDSGFQNTVAVVVIPVVTLSAALAFVIIGLVWYCRFKRGPESTSDLPDRHQAEPLLEKKKRELSEKHRIIIQRLKLDEVLQVFIIGENLKTDIKRAECSRDQVKYLLENITDAEEMNLYKLIAGIQPGLFKEVKGREPTKEEIDFCLQPYVTSLREKIAAASHKPDRAYDAKLGNLHENFIQLHLVDDSGKSKKKGIKSRLDKKAIDIKDILSTSSEKEDTDGLKKSKFIVLKGRAGVGKTTLLQYLAKLWAKGEWGSQFVVIFLLKMREVMSMTEPLTLSDLLVRHGFYKTGTTIPASWISSNLDRIGVMIDGIDEYGYLTSRLSQPEEIVEMDEKKSADALRFDIINRHLMKSSTLIITSRPLTALVHLNPHKKIEVVGLSEEKITEYINSSSSEAAKTKIFRILKSMPHLMSLCQITFYCMAFCQIFGEEDEEFHELNTYTSIMAFVILKHACRHQSPTESLGVRRLVEGAKPYLPALAKLAYRGLKPSTDGARSTKVIFTEKDLGDTNIPKDSHQTGLIHEETITSPVGHEETYTEFAHLCIQEFLGMAHISRDADEMKEYLKKTGLQDDAMLTAPFLFGLVYNTNNMWICAVVEALGRDMAENGNQAKQTIKEFIKETCDKLHPEKATYSKERKSLNQTIMKLCLLAYEAQCVELAEEVATAIVAEKPRLHLTGVPLTAMEVNAITFVINRCTGLTNLKIDNCQLDKACFQTIAKYIAGAPHLTELDLSQNKISIKSLRSLSDAIKSKRILAKLILEECELDSTCVKEIVNLLDDVRCITHLNLNRNVFGDEAMEYLADHVSRSDSLTDLSMMGMRAKITDRGVKYMADALRENTSLKEMFSINNNSFTDDGVIALANALRENQKINVRKIGLATFEMTDEGAHAILKLVKEKRPKLVRITDINLSEMMKDELKKHTPPIDIHY